MVLNTRFGRMSEYFLRRNEGMIRLQNGKVWKQQIGLYREAHTEVLNKKNALEISTKKKLSQMGQLLY